MSRRRAAAAAAGVRGERDHRRPGVRARGGPRDPARAAAAATRAVAVVAGGRSERMESKSSCGRRDAVRAPACGACCASRCVRRAHTPRQGQGQRGRGPERRQVVGDREPAGFTPPLQRVTARPWASALWASAPWASAAGRILRGQGRRARSTQTGPPQGRRAGCSGGMCPWGGPAPPRTPLPPQPPPRPHPSHPRLPRTACRPTSTGARAAARQAGTARPLRSGRGGGDPAGAAAAASSRRGGKPGTARGAGTPAGPTCRPWHRHRRGGRRAGQE